MIEENLVRFPKILSRFNFTRLSDLWKTNVIAQVARRRAKLLRVGRNLEDFLANWWKGEPGPLAFGPLSNFGGGRNYLDFRILVPRLRGRTPHFTKIVLLDFQVEEVARPPQTIVPFKKNPFALRVVGACNREQQRHFWWWCGEFLSRNLSSWEKDCHLKCRERAQCLLFFHWNFSTTGNLMTKWLRDFLFPFATGQLSWLRWQGVEEQSWNNSRCHRRLGCRSVP